VTDSSLVIPSLDRYEEESHWLFSSYIGPSPALSVSFFLLGCMMLFDNDDGDFASRLLDLVECFEVQGYRYFDETPGLMLK